MPEAKAGRLPSSKLTRLNARALSNTAVVVIACYHHVVAQILIRQLDEDVKARLQRRARQHGRSTEEEVREILRNAVREDQQPPARLGSRIAARFAKIGLDDPIPDLRGHAVEPARFDS
jgi:antitoxin FitA